MNVSPDFSPPLRIMAPYFLIGALSYLFSTVTLFGLEASMLAAEIAVIRWVHLYLLGFVMMLIFGSMAQIAPVVSEVMHAAVWVYRLVWPLLLSGTLFLLAGFTFETVLLPVGGGCIVLALALFGAELWLTLRNARRKSAVVTSMRVASYFLLAGVAAGVMMAAAYAGWVDIRLPAWRNAHVAALLGGYVMITAMGVSMVLLPMFGVGRRVSDNAFTAAFRLMVAGCALMMGAALAGWQLLEQAAAVMMMASLLAYFYQAGRIAASRARPERDIWSRSVTLAFGALLLSWLGFAAYLLGMGERYLILAMWLLLVGFIGFLIIGNLYKILPFLVWFQYYSPYVGERDVPLLHEMVPTRLADAQFAFSATGFALASLGILFTDDTLFSAGVSFLVTGAAFWLAAVRVMLRVRA